MVRVCVCTVLVLVKMILIRIPEGMLGRPRLEMPSPRDPTNDDS